MKKHHDIIDTKGDCVVGLSGCMYTPLHARASPPDSIDDVSREELQVRNQLFSHALPAPVPKPHYAQNVT